MNPGDTLGIGEFKAFAARRQQVPAQSTIANATLEYEYRRFGSLPDVMTDTDFRADPSALDGHPLVIETSHATGAAAHDPHVAHVLTFRPFPRVVHQVRIQLLRLHRVLQRSILVTGNPAETQHVGLPQQDVDLDRLGQICGLAVRVRQLPAGVRVDLLGRRRIRFAGRQ